MDYLRILYLAWYKAIDYWHYWLDQTEKYPNSELAEDIREKKWEEVKQLQEMIIKEERKNG